MLALLMIWGCSRNVNADNHQGKASVAKDFVEVLYFHGKQRCVTCRSIEKNTKDLLDAKFADKMKQGKIVLRVIDISQRENEAIAEKYQITWSSLVLVRHKGGKEQAENVTEMAFANSRTRPDKFKADLEQRINNMLR
jgi:hypothetical protein